MKTRMILAVFLLFAGLLTIPACHTVEGFGKDLKQLGEHIEDEAEEEQKD